MLTGTQKHDLSTYIEHKLQEMYSTRHVVAYTRHHTQYALYVSTVMRGELLWSVHLHIVTQRHHMQHLSHTKCTLCRLPITHTHAHADRPILFLRTWYICVKLSHLLPSMNLSWHRSLFTPWGILVATPIGHIVLLVNPVKYIRVPHDLCVIGLIGEVSSQSMHMATKHGSTNTMMTRILGSLLTTWSKIQHIEGPPLLQAYQEYAVSRNPYGMTMHILTNQESLHRQWDPWTGDRVLWPSPPLLYQIAHQYSLNVHISHMLLPSPNLSPVLCWYITEFVGSWRASPDAAPSVAFFNTPKPLQMKGCFVGITHWSIMYGYPKHRRYVTSINEDQHRKFTSQAAIMQQVFGAIFTSLAILIIQDY